MACSSGIQGSVLITKWCVQERKRGREYSTHFRFIISIMVMFAVTLVESRDNKIKREDDHRKNLKNFLNISIDI